MNKKKLIQIVVIICAFGGSGIVLYNGLSKNNQTVAGRSSSPATATSSLQTGASGNGPNLPATANGAVSLNKNLDEILPNGGTLNLDVVNRPRVAYDILSLPKVNPKQEVGIDESLLIISLPKQSSNNGGLLKSP